MDSLRFLIGIYYLTTALRRPDRHNLDSLFARPELLKIHASIVVRVGS